MPVSAFAHIPEKELYIFEAPTPGPLVGDRLAGAGPVPQWFSYRMLTQEPVRTKSGNIRITDSRLFAAAKTIAAALVEIEPGGMRELHWHTNGDEFQYYLSGQARMTVFNADANAGTFDYHAGDVGYVPRFMPHYVENTGSTTSPIANSLVKEDQLVMENTGKPSQFLTIAKYPKDKWVIALVTKAAICDAENRVSGTFGYGQDLTHLYAKHLVNKTELSANSYFIWNNLLMPNEDIKLTPRQAECLFLLLNGKSIKKIAQILKLSVRTIEEFTEQLRQKFACQNKFELIEKAINLGYNSFIPMKFINYFTHIIDP